MTQTAISQQLKRKVIATDKAPTPVGPYAQAIHVGNTLFIAGQVGINPATGKLVKGGIKAQAEQVLQNLSAILEAAGASLDRVAKTTVFLADFDDFADMNEVYARFFADAPPARSAFEVARLPLGALLEIEAIAVIE